MPPEPTTATHPAAVEPQALRALTGYRSPAAVERWCQRHGVRYFPSRNGPWTTIAALNAALGIGEPPPEQPKRIEF
jgi:hypothetical protein